MTTTENRRAGVTSVLPHLMPLAVVLVLFGLSVPLAMVAPGRVTSGVYRVVVGNIMAPSSCCPPRR